MLYRAFHLDLAFVLTMGVYCTLVVRIVYALAFGKNQKATVAKAFAPDKEGSIRACNADFERIVNGKGLEKAVEEALLLLLPGSHVSLSSVCPVLRLDN